MHNKWLLCATCISFAFTEKLQKHDAQEKPLASAGTNTPSAEGQMLILLVKRGFPSEHQRLPIGDTFAARCLTDHYRSCAEFRVFCNGWLRVAERPSWIGGYLVCLDPSHPLHGEFLALLGAVGKVK
jgi:hypothetical protein